MKRTKMWAIGWSASTPQPFPTDDPRGPWKITSWVPTERDTVSASQKVETVCVTVEKTGEDEAIIPLKDDPDIRAVIDAEVNRVSGMAGMVAYLEQELLWAEKQQTQPPLDPVADASKRAERLRTVIKIYARHSSTGKCPLSPHVP